MSSYKHCVPSLPFINFFLRMSSLLPPDFFWIDSDHSTSLYGCIISVHLSEVHCDVLIHGCMGQGSIQGDERIPHGQLSSFIDSEYIPIPLFYFEICHALLITFSRLNHRTPAVIPAVHPWHCPHRQVCLSSPFPLHPSPPLPFNFFALNFNEVLFLGFHLGLSVCGILLSESGLFQLPSSPPGPFMSPQTTGSHAFDG